VVTVRDLGGKYMKIAFLGDSITEGVPGVSYVEILKRHFNEDRVINSGTGCYTIFSLFNRIIKIDDFSDYNSVLLFV